MNFDHIARIALAARIALEGKGKAWTELDEKGQADLRDRVRESLDNPKTGKLEKGDAVFEAVVQACKELL